MITSLEQLFFIVKIKLPYKMSEVFQQILTSERDFSFETYFSSFHFTHCNDS